MQFRETLTMRMLTEIEQTALIALQEYPEQHARYLAGDPTVVAPLQAIQHVLYEFGRDLDITEVEPFLKTRDATILADASNKGILPLATAARHVIEVINQGNSSVSLANNRQFQDGQGRTWRFLQTANIEPGQMIEIEAEQSTIRTVTYTPAVTEPFHLYKLNLSDDESLVSLSVTDQNDVIYSFVNRWMNTKSGDAAIALKTDSRRYIFMEFGDSDRFGTTLTANNTLNIQVIETTGRIDLSALKEASLLEVRNTAEQRIIIRFKTGGVIKSGADPLSTEQMRLLSSYPTYDENAVFLGNFDFLIRKIFMNRADFISTWNEVVQEENYGGSYANIGKMFICVHALASAEQSSLETEIEQLIARVDNLYKNNVVKKTLQERAYQLTIKGGISTVHDIDSVKEQIKTLLLKNYGKGSIAASYYLPNGFNNQEITELLKKEISAFQDRTSDCKIQYEDLEQNPVKPHQWLFMSEDSIVLDIKPIKGLGESRWSVL